MCKHMQCTMIDHILYVRMSMPNDAKKVKSKKYCTSFKIQQIKIKIKPDD